jgi:6-phospho-3-hexuloisomerase
VQIARIAKDHGARVALITSARQSTLKDLADVVVHLPAPTKLDASAGAPSLQPMSTVFDQALHVFGDAVALLLQEKQGLRAEDLWAQHANLE